MKNFLYTQKIVTGLIIILISATNSYSQTESSTYQTGNTIGNEVLTESKILRLTIVNTDNSNSDEAILLFNPAAGSGYNSWDSPKAFNYNPELPELWTKEGSTNLVINSLPYIYSGFSIILYQTTLKPVQHKIIADFSDFDTSVQILIEDTETGFVHDLRTGDYYFYADSLENYSRFILYLEPLATSINEKPQESNMINLIINEIPYFLPLFSGDIIKIYNIQGVIIDVINTEKSLTPLYYCSGVYFITCGNENNQTVRKIFVE